MSSFNNTIITISDQDGNVLAWSSSGLNNFKGFECCLPGGGFYAFPKVIETGMNGQEFAKKWLHDAGVAIVPGTAFGKKAVDYVRFSFAASQNDISKALEKIRKMLV